MNRNNHMSNFIVDATKRQICETIGRVKGTIFPLSLEYSIIIQSENVFEIL